MHELELTDIQKQALLLLARHDQQTVLETLEIDDQTWDSWHKNETFLLELKHTYDRIRQQSIRDLILETSQLMEDYRSLKEHLTLPQRAEFLKDLSQLLNQTQAEDPRTPERQSQDYWDAYRYRSEQELEYEDDDEEDEDEDEEPEEESIPSEDPRESSPPRVGEGAPGWGEVSRAPEPSPTIPPLRAGEGGLQAGRGLSEPPKNNGCTTQPEQDPSGIRNPKSADPEAA